jgi:plastocyanin
MQKRTTRYATLFLFFFVFSRCTCMAEKPANHTILIGGFKYQPDTLTVSAGDTVEWQNNDIVPHTVTATDKSFSSGAIRPGATWKFVAKKTGNFPYVCTPHPNMHGKLIVQ